VIVKREVIARTVWENSVGEQCGRTVWENSVGEQYGRTVWENSMGEQCGRICSIIVSVTDKLRWKK